MYKVVGSEYCVPRNYMDTFAEQCYSTMILADADSAVLIPAVHVWYDG